MTSTTASATELDLAEADLEEIVQILSVFKSVEVASVFCSRAKGTYKPGSDVDIAVFGSEINFSTTRRIRHFLEGGTYMPYFFDGVDAAHLKHEGLKDHIERVGKLIYSREVPA